MPRFRQSQNGEFGKALTFKLSNNWHNDSLLTLKYKALSITGFWGQNGLK